jgi:membrane protease YdiL (CAAX protease family)
MSVDRRSRVTASTVDTRSGAKTLWLVVFFVVLAYVFSWAAAFPLVAEGDVVKKGVGWPSHVPALLGPALAALAVTGLVWRRAGIRDLVAHIARWQMPVRWWVATLSPLAFLTVGLAAASATGKLPRAGDFGRYSGLPAIGVVPVVLIAILITFGEETGWCGFALPQLQRRYGALAAALIVAPIWVVWHLPFFFSVSTYRAFPPAGYVGLPSASPAARSCSPGSTTAPAAASSRARYGTASTTSRAAPPARPGQSPQSPAPLSTPKLSCLSRSSCAPASGERHRS